MNKLTPQQIYHRMIDRAALERLWEAATDTDAELIEHLQHDDLLGDREFDSFRRLPSCED